MAAEQLTLPPPTAAVAVIGDVMMDDNMYLTYGHSDPISGDRAALKSMSAALGGAGNVAANVAGTGLGTALVGMVGDDAHGGRVQNLARGKVNLYQMLFVADGIRTPRKLRLYGQHTLRTRIDDEGRPVSYYSTARGRAPLRPTPLEVCRWLAGRGIKVFCTVDHGKGFLLDDGSDHSASVLQRELRTLDVPIIVDPKPNINWPYIGGRKVILKVNHQQLNEVVGRPVGEEWVIPAYLGPSEAKRHFDRVRETIKASRAIHCEWLWLTYGKSGMSIGPMDESWSVFTDAHHGPAVDINDIRIDPTGCGDTCTAMMANSIALRGYSTQSVLAGFVAANCAAGRAARYLGCHVLSPSSYQEVLNEVASTEDYGRVLGHVA